MDEPAFFVDALSGVLCAKGDFLENFVFNNLVVLSFHV